MTIYITRSDLELVFGIENIKRWADLDGDGDSSKITARIAYAINAACANFDDVMRGHQYTELTINATLKDLVARMAAIKLYDAREMIDGDPTSDKMSIVRQYVNDTLSKIRKGEITLEGTRATATPSVVPMDTKNNNGTVPNSPFYGVFAPNYPF